MELSERTAWLSVLVNLMLTGIKAGLAYHSGSLAIRADALHSLADVAAATIIVAGIRLARRPSTRFPYGLYKVENLVALGVSGLIFLAGYEIAREVLAGDGSVLNPAAVPVAAGGILLTIAITFFFSRYELQRGRETASPSLKADARHVWTDMLSSMVILAALIGSRTGLPVDRWAALVVVVFIARTGFTILVDSVRVLLDASLDRAAVDRLRAIVLADPRVTAINHLWARNAGRYKFIELDLTLRVRELEAGHRVAAEIRGRLENALENVDHVLIHCQPRQRDGLTLAVPLAADRSTIAEHFGEAPAFRLRTMRQRNGRAPTATLPADALPVDAVRVNPYAGEEKGRGIKVANWLLEQGLDIMVVRRDLAGKGPGFVLGNAGVEILVTTETDAEKALADVCTGITR
ncbi:MAG: cation diffusion facilitator family transporter [Deltaproteobacteria bacterium]|nr:cation diffusion facilitator family transporter [Candidatus Anaeroferrophillacea bacterium]